MRWSNIEFNIQEMQLLKKEIDSINFPYAEFKNAADLVRQPKLMQERFWLRKMGAVKLTEYGEYIILKPYFQYREKLKQLSAFKDWQEYNNKQYGK